MDVKYPKMIHTDLDAFVKIFQVKKFGPWDVEENIYFSILSDKVLISHLRMEGNIFIIQTKFQNVNTPMF